MALRRFVITGATSGIGLATARELARRGAALVLACRNMEKAARVRDELATFAPVDVVRLDLASLASVRECAGEIASAHESVDVLVNNAGVFSMMRQETPDGFELTIGVNHLGPFLFTHLLVPLLRCGDRARIVNVASAAYRYGRLDLADLQRTRWGSNVGWAGFRAYAASRLATVLFTRELARRLEPDRITANSVHPGHVDTSIFPEAPGVMGVMMRFSSRFRIPAADGAGPVVRLATDDSLAEVTGEYFNRFSREDVPARIADPGMQARLWGTSAALTGVDG